jgi:hypothetical protein
MSKLNKRIKQFLCIIFSSQFLSQSYAMQQNIPEGHPIAVSPDQGYILPGRVADQCQSLTTRNHFPEIHIDDLLEFAAFAWMPSEYWLEHAKKCHVKGTFPAILNTAGALQHKSLCEFGCKFVAEMIKTKLHEEKQDNLENKRQSLLLPREEEEAQREFEQLILAAIRLKDREMAAAQPKIDK